MAQTAPHSGRPKQRGEAMNTRTPVCIRARPGGLRQTLRHQPRTRKQRRRGSRRWRRLRPRSRRPRRRRSPQRPRASSKSGNCLGGLERRLMGPSGCVKRRTGSLPPARGRLHTTSPRPAFQQVGMTLKAVENTVLEHLLSQLKNNSTAVGQ